ncbi:unnamed protein product, partial [Hapterophycus canaliculatus]
GGATGTVDFLAQHTQWKPSPLTRVDRLDAKVLQPGQHYKVGLELRMPTSYTNRRVGVFMVHTTLLDHEDNELATSARPAMLPHTSALRKGIGMVFSWPLHVAGLKEEAETVSVDCMDFYEENAAHPLTKAVVTVSSSRVQFYRSSINITPELQGLPWLMRDWFYSTLAAGVLFIASLELMFFGFCYVFFFLGLEDPANSSRGRENAQDPKDNGRNGQIPEGTAAANSYRSGAAVVVREGVGVGISDGEHHEPAEAGNGMEAAESAATAATAATAAAAAVAAAEGGDFRDENCLRRRTGAGAGAAPGSAAANGAASRAGGYAPPYLASRNRAEMQGGSLVSWLGASLPTQSSSSFSSSDRRQSSAAAAAAAATALPAGVQEYQRGARYVVRGSRPASAGAGASGGGGGDGGGVYES